MTASTPQPILQHSRVAELAQAALPIPPSRPKRIHRRR